MDNGPDKDSKVGKVRMKVKELFKHAVEKISTCLVDVMKDVNLSIININYVISHQANYRIIGSSLKKLNLPKDKIINTIDIHRLHQLLLLNCYFAMLLKIV